MTKENKCASCAHCEMCRWIDEVHQDGCDFYAGACRDVVCHTNLKENAELIAKILDADACREVFLDKIRAEIESCREDEEPHLCDYRYHRNEGLEMALDIINKYKAESGEKE